MLDYIVVYDGAVDEKWARCEDTANLLDATAAGASILPADMQVNV